MMDDILKRLQLPAIILVVFGFINGISGLIVLISGLVRLLTSQEVLPANETRMMGFIFATIMIYGVAFVSVIIAPIIIFGAFQMMNGKRALLVNISAVLAMLPFTACCFLFGIPVGAWTLYVMTRPEIKAAFNGTPSPINYTPPQPPSF